MASASSETWPNAMLWRAGRIGLVLLLHVALFQLVVSDSSLRRVGLRPPSVDVALITPPKPVLPPEPPKLAPKPHPAATPPKRAPLVAAKSVVADDSAFMTIPEEKVRVVTPKAEPAPPLHDAPEVHVPAHVDAAMSCATPEYPIASRRAGEDGTVRLLFLIATDGQVIESRVEVSSGSPRLDDAARQALSLCHFTPGTVDGRLERSWARLDYVWRLK